MASLSYFQSLENHYLKLMHTAISARREEVCAGLLEHDRYKYVAGVLAGLREAEALFQKALKETMHN